MTLKARIDLDDVQETCMVAKKLKKFRHTKKTEREQRFEITEKLELYLIFFLNYRVILN